VAPGGVVDRAAVARRAFATPEDRAWLEQLLWPRVGARMAEWRAGQSAREPAPRALVVEVPLLFEAGIEGIFDATVAVVADEAVRAERAGTRDQAGLAGREGRQLSQDEKAHRADYLVRNDGTLADLERAMAEVLDQIRRRAAA